MASIALILLASSFVASSLEGPEELPALLCLSHEPASFRSDAAACKPAAEKLAPEAVDVPRLYVWINSDQTSVSFGHLPAGARAIDTNGDKIVRLQIDSPSRDWPAATELILRSATGDVWKWSVPAMEVRKLRSLAVPKEADELSIMTPGHDPFAVRIPPQPTVSLGRVRLLPVPLITGRVLDRRTSEPLPGSVVALPTGETLALAGYDGGFVAALPPGQQPESVVVSYAGYGMRSVPLPKGRADVTLPPILLAPAGLLHLTVERDTDRYPTIHARLARKELRQQVDVGRATLDAARSEWILEGLDEGDYVVVLSGVETQQRLAHAVRIDAGETATLKLKVEAIELAGSVRRGSRGVASPKLTIKASPLAWTATILGDERGEFSTELWQAGRFVTSITAPELRAPYSFMEELKVVGNKVRWDIGVPSGTVAGIVRDAKTRAAIPGAHVTLDSELLHRDVTTSLGAISDTAGHFTFEGVASGTHSLHVEAEGYAARRGTSFTFATDNDQKEIEIALTRANTYSIIVTSIDHAPMPGAVVLHEGSIPTAPAMTDFAGKTTVDIEPGLRTLLMAVPRTGSFGLARSGDHGQDPVRIVVPPPAGSMIVRTLDERTGEPIGNVGILIRYNAEFLPPSLVAMTARFTGMKTVTDPRGLLVLQGLPTGTYELWPYAGLAEAHNILRGGLRPAATVGLSRGEYAVNLKFNAPGARSTNGIATTDSRSAASR